MRTMKELAREALDIQSAINLSGVIHSFSRAITEVREHLRADGKESTQAVNMHPICVLYSSKIASLTYSESIPQFHGAYEWANKEVES